jgi:hypothetical protein
VCEFTKTVAEISKATRPTTIASQKKRTAFFGEVPGRLGNGNVQGKDQKFPCLNASDKTQVAFDEGEQTTGRSAATDKALDATFSYWECGIYESLLL